MHNNIESCYITTESNSPNDKKKKTFVNNFISARRIWWDKCKFHFDQINKDGNPHLITICLNNKHQLLVSQIDDSQLTEALQTYSIRLLILNIKKINKTVKIQNRHTQRDKNNISKQNHGNHVPNPTEIFLPFSPSHTQKNTFSL